MTSCVRHPEIQLTCIGPDPLVDQLMDAAIRAGALKQMLLCSQ